MADAAPVLRNERTHPQRRTLPAMPDEHESPSQKKEGMKTDRNADPIIQVLRALPPMSARLLPYTVRLYVYRVDMIVRSERSYSSAKV